MWIKEDCGNIVFNMEEYNKYTNILEYLQYIDEEYKDLININTRLSLTLLITNLEIFLNNISIEL